MLTLNESESEVVLMPELYFLVCTPSLSRSTLLFNPLNGLAKIVEAMHGLSQPVQFAIVILIGFSVFCMTIVAIFCHLN